MEGRCCPHYPASFSNLPDNAVEHIFRCLRLGTADRHRVLPFVCKRWAQLTLSPRLLRVTRVLFRGPDVDVLPRVQAFSAWLAQAAPQVRQLVIHVHAAGVEQAMWEEQCDTHASLAAALACCGSAGLEQLEISGNWWPCLPFGSWAGMLGSRLRSLCVATTWYEIVVRAPLTALASLESLEIFGPATWYPDARLPPSLTELKLTTDLADALPSQVAALTRLRSLTLEQCDVKSAGYDAVLPRLGSLRCLSLDCRQLPTPACISRLPQLTSLSLRHWGGGDMREEVTAFLASLPHLRHFRLVPGDSSAGMQLPAGAWLDGLRSLATSAWVLGDSLPTLAAATQLEELEVLCFASADGATRAALLHWAGSHAPLCRLVVDLLPPLAHDAALAALQAKPALQLFELRGAPEDVEEDADAEPPFVGLEEASEGETSDSEDSMAEALLANDEQSQSDSDE